MSAERLRRVVAEMREYAEAATPGDWFHIQVPGSRLSNDGAWIVDSPGQFICSTQIETERGEADARHIAAWSPPVVVAVADLLDLAAGHEKREGDECGQGWGPGPDWKYGYIDPSCSQCGTPDEYAEPWPCAYATRALALADAWEATR